MLKAVVFAVALLSGAPAIAQDYPNANCALNADASSVLVTASNPGATAYQCLVECRANMTGQRAISPIKCTFNLSAHAREKTVCDVDGGAPAFFSAVTPVKYTCVPR